VRQGRKVILVCLVIGGAAEARDRIGMSVLALPMSVRQMGMGYVVPGGRDFLRGWSNPALIADQETRGEVAVNGASMWGGQETTGGLGVGWRLGPSWVVGGMLNYCALGAPELDASGNEAGRRLSQDTASAGVATAWRYHALRAGTTVKQVSEKLTGDSTSVTAADLGAALVHEGFSLAASIRNVGPKLRSIDGTGMAEFLPTEMRLGASAGLPSWNLIACVDYVRPAGLESSAGAGAEWWPSKSFAIRGGARGLGGKDSIQLTGGLSARYRGLTLDYALCTHPLGLTNRMSVAYGFGGPAVEPVYPPPSARAPRPEIPPEGKVEAVPLPSPAPQGGMTNIAVADLRPENASGGDAAIISEILRSELVRQKNITVVEKGEMSRILSEQAFQQTGCTTDECVVKLGKLLNVRRIISGIFGRLLDNYYIQIRVIDVETGKITYAESARGKSIEDIEAAIRKLAERIAKSIR